MSAERSLTAYESHLQAEGMAVVPVAKGGLTEELLGWAAEIEEDPAFNPITNAAVVQAFRNGAAEILRLRAPASPYGKAGKEKDDE